MDKNSEENEPVKHWQRDHDGWECDVPMETSLDIDGLLPNESLLRLIGRIQDLCHTAFGKNHFKRREKKKLSGLC